MLPIREGLEADLPEVFRLVNLLADSGEVPVAGEPWEANAHAYLSNVLGVSTRLAVVDHPLQMGRIVAIGLAMTTQSLPSYWLPNGKLGYFQWFYTDDEFRRQGLASRILEDLAEWLRQQDVLWAHLYTSARTKSFYLQKGFEPSINEECWLRLH